MAAMSSYLENALLSCIFNNVAFTPPAIYIALLTTDATNTDTGTSISDGTGTGIEVGTSGTGYSRLLVNNWLTPNNGTTLNSTTLVFPTAQTNWGTINGIAICDTQTDGNMLFYGTLSTPKPVSSNDIIEFDNGSFMIVLG